MKSIVSFVAALVLFAALSVNAQSYTAQTLSLGFSDVAASTASNSVAVIDARKAQNVGIQFKFASSAANTAIGAVYLVPSVDGVNYDTTRLVGIHAAAVSAGTVVTFTTNLATGGIGYWKIAYITNANQTANLTNVSVKYSLKLNAP